jgi:hypothetical protein
MSTAGRELALSELALSTLRAEHRQLASDVPVDPPLVSRVLVLARLAAAVGADKRLVRPRGRDYKGW